MRTLTCCTVSLAAAATLLLAGCASTPAPVVNHSFGPNGQPAGGAAPATPVAAGHPGGAQTFGLGSHANGSVSHGDYTVAPGDTLYSIAFAHGLDFRALAARNAIAPPYTIHPGQVLQLGIAAPAPAAVAMTPAVAPPPAQQPAKPGAPVFGPVTPQTMAAGGVAAAPTATPPSAASTVGAVPPVQPAVAPAPAVPPPAPVPSAAPTSTSIAPGPTRNVAGIVWQWPVAGKPISTFQPDVSGDGAGIDVAGKLGDPVRAAAAGTVVYSGNGLPGYGDLVIIKHNDTYLSAYGHNSKRLVQEGQHVAAGQEIALMGASGAPRVELHFEIRKDGKPVDPMDYLPGR